MDYSSPENESSDIEIIMPGPYSFEPSASDSGRSNSESEASTDNEKILSDLSW